jgi:hypothetical protein
METSDKFLDIREAIILALSDPGPKDALNDIYKGAPKKEKDYIVETFIDEILFLEERLQKAYSLLDDISKECLLLRAHRTKGE